MIDEKYRRNPKNITDFLKEEKFRYICKMEFEYKNEKYKEIEQCDVFLERIEKFEIEKEEFFVYRIKEENHEYDVPYLKEKLFETYIFNEIFLLTDKKFNIMSILNLENVIEKIKMIQDEVKKLENVNLKLKYSDLENLKRFVSNEKAMTKFLLNYRFLNVFLNDLKNKNKEIIIFGNKIIPIFLNIKKENGVYILKGHQDYSKMSTLRLKDIIEREIFKKVENVNVDFKRLLLQESNITVKVDSFTEINIENYLKYEKREFLEKFENKNIILEKKREEYGYRIR